MLTTDLLEELRRRQILLPAASAIEQFISQVRAQADTAIFAQLTIALSFAQRERLDGLLTVRDGRETQFSWLEGFPRRPVASRILSIIERIAYLNELAVPSQFGQNIAPQRLAKLARSAGRGSTPLNRGSRSYGLFQLIDRSRSLFSAFRFYPGR
jgi:hypothetical protein